MSFTNHRVTQLIDNLDRIATALERLADNHGAPTPHADDPRPHDHAAATVAEHEGPSTVVQWGR